MWPDWGAVPGFFALTVITAHPRCHNLIVVADVIYVTYAAPPAPLGLQVHLSAALARLSLSLCRHDDLDHLAVESQQITFVAWDLGIKIY